MQRSAIRTRRVRVCCVLAATFAVAVSSPPAEAGSLGRSVAKAATARLWNGSAGKGVAVRHAKKPANTALAREHGALTQQLRQLDDQALGRIEQRYGAYISPQRLSQARATQSRFLDRAAYQGQLRRSYPDMSADRRRNVVGNYVGGKLYLDRNQVLLPRTAAHERIHQLADPRFRARAGSRLDEGMTEYFAGHIYGDLGIRSLPRAYPREQRVVEMLTARLGEEQLARAYFRGGAGRLRQQLDRQLGAGSFDDLVRALERGRYGTAEGILKAGR